MYTPQPDETCNVGKSPDLEWSPPRLVRGRTLQPNGPPSQALQFLQIRVINNRCTVFLPNFSWWVKKNIWINKSYSPLNYIPMKNIKFCFSFKSTSSPSFKSVSSGLTGFGTEGQGSADTSLGAWHSAP